MNFLSHYYIERHNPDPDFTLGVILPDLARSHNKKLRFRENLSAGISLSGSLVQLHQGVVQHHKADYEFHNSPYFQKNTELLKELLQHYEFSVLKKHVYFMAHIALELLIDRYLLKQHKDLYKEFYDKLKRVSNTTISDYFLLTGYSMWTNRFLDFYDLFNKNQYLQYYTDTDQMAFALNKIYSRATGTDLSDDKEKMKLFIVDAEEAIQKPDFFLFS